MEMQQYQQTELFSDRVDFMREQIMRVVGSQHQSIEQIREKLNELCLYQQQRTLYYSKYLFKNLFTINLNLSVR